MFQWCYQLPYRTNYRITPCIVKNVSKYIRLALLITCIDNNVINFVNLEKKLAIFNQFHVLEMCYMGVTGVLLVIQRNVP